MPYIVRDIDDQQVIRIEALKKQPLGPGFSEKTVSKAVRLIVTGSTMKDDGPDWTKFELQDAKGKTIACKMIPGY